jgi:hypothetical protein
MLSHASLHRCHSTRTSFSECALSIVGFGSGFGIGFTLLLTRSFTRSSSSRHPPFTQYPFPSRSLVRDGQTSPQMPRLVVPHSTCPSLSPSPPRTQLYNRFCSNKHTHTLVQLVPHSSGSLSYCSLARPPNYSLPRPRNGNFAHASRSYDPRNLLELGRVWAKRDEKNANG